VRGAADAVPRRLGLEDVERLTTILRLQRDEFLPLRVIREELDGPGATGDRTRRRSVGLLGHEDEIDEAELCERASVSPEIVRQLEEFGLIVSRSESGERIYGESEADIAAACARLARFGIDARHLRTFLTAAGRQAVLVEQLVAPGLRSRNPERRKTALGDMEALSRVAQELSHLLFVRDLRATVERTS
jgi:DNA-binding transcriptional MerR regulator